MLRCPYLTTTIELHLPQELQIQTLPYTDPSHEEFVFNNNTYIITSTTMGTCYKEECAAWFEGKCTYRKEN